MPIPVPGRVVEALRRSVVQVRSGAGSRLGSGSGGVLNSEHIITNAHVITGGKLSVESWEGKTLAASVLKLDRRRDLALLSAPGINAPGLTLADSTSLRVGTPVVAVGNPMGFVGAVSSGVVHATGSFGPLGGDWIQADVRLAPGNSGGPLADFAGGVIGINTMIVSGGLALAIPSRVVQAFLARKGQPRSMGLTARPVNLPGNRLALLVLELIRGAAADAASLLPGDLLIGVNGRALKGVDDLENAIDDTPDGTLRLEFYRGGQERSRRVTVRLSEERSLHAA